MIRLERNLNTRTNREPKFKLQINEGERVYLKGNWKRVDVSDELFDYYYICDCCGYETPAKAFSLAPLYCPNCGADMT